MSARTLQKKANDPVVFMPNVRGEDPSAQYWLRQATLRLRREICWLWRERELQGARFDQGAPLPPPVDRAIEALDLVRYDGDRRSFFADDITARHLTESMLASREPSVENALGGSFGWVVRRLRLVPVECFALAVALLPIVDSAAGQVLSTCLNDPNRQAPTLGLVQRLWDRPDEVMRCFDPAHPLLRHGLITFGAGAPASGDWQAPLAVPALVARQLLFPDDELPSSLVRVSAGALPQAMEASALARVDTALRADDAEGMRIVPLIGSRGASLDAVAAACARRAGIEVVRPGSALPREHLAQALSTAWLRGLAVYLPAAALHEAGAHHEAPASSPPLPGLPLTVFVGAHERSELRGLDDALPALQVPPLDYAQRLECWRRTLDGDDMAAVLPELARRYRYEEATIERIGAQLQSLQRRPSAGEVLAAARADLELGTLAQAVEPRFSLAELMLPNAQEAQMREIVAAMSNLTRVHYEWGTARAWNESGLAVLFHGPPGTGKTMAAEALASELAMPLYRIDLSQVVNKYIGETEKNLRRLFDAADSADVILFFDEADALFGKRTEVKDAHDRYANLEISYLLERMERFKGLAVLATNRKKDLDEAFLRRLRFVVEFPLPGPAERLRIWRSVIPAGVDASGVDFEFLSQRFALAGGHIRAIVFHACLQSASDGAPRALAMSAIVRAVQREFDKLDRASSLDQFGPYADLVASQRSVR